MLNEILDDSLKEEKLPKEQLDAMILAVVEHISIEFAVPDYKFERVEVGASDDDAFKGEIFRNTNFGDFGRTFGGVSFMLQFTQGDVVLHIQLDRRDAQAEVHLMQTISMAVDGEGKWRVKSVRGR